MLSKQTLVFDFNQIPRQLTSGTQNSQPTPKQLNKKASLGGALPTGDKQFML